MQFGANCEEGEVVKSCDFSEKKYNKKRVSLEDYKIRNGGKLGVPSFDSERFSIREYARKIRSVEVRKCWPFSGEVTGDFIQSLLPPITVVKFRWWSHELASLLAKSPVDLDDSNPSFRQKTKVKSRPCKKRSIVEIFATPQTSKSSEIQKKIKRKRFKDSGDQKFANKVNKLKEQSLGMVDGEKCSLGIKESSVMMSSSSKKARLVCNDQVPELQIPAILKAQRRVSLVKSPHKQARFSDQSEQKTSITSSELCCLEMNRLSLSSSEDQLRKVMFNDHSSDVMQSESKQQSEFQHEVSERESSHDLSCFPGSHLTSLERVKVALDLERKKHLAQPVQSFISSKSESPIRACSSFSQPASADMLMHQSSLDPLLVQWMEKSVLYRQRHVGEEILGFPLNLQGELVEANGEGCVSFDRSSLGTCSAATENDVLLGKQSSEPALPMDGAGRFPVHNEKRHMCYPARLGIDETFSENTFFISDTNDGKCDHAVQSPVSEVNPRSHTTCNGLNQNSSIRNMVTNCDGLCIHNTRATMRLMGKDVSVGTNYSDMVRIDERIIAPDCSFLESYSNQSWLWRRTTTTTLGVSENHSTTTLDMNWNRAFIHDTSKDPFTLHCETHVPDSEFTPCCSLASFPSSDKDLSFFHGSGLEQPNSFTFSQQQLPFLFNHNNVDIGLLPGAKKSYTGLPFSCTDSTIHSHPPWPQSSSESTCSGMSYINPTEQLVSLYGSKSSSSYIPMQNHRVPQLSLQEFYGSQQIRRQI